MFNDFITSFKLKNTYRVNGIIYSLKQIPGIKNILPEALYASKGLKTFANVISILSEIGGIFLGKIIYLLLMVVLAMKLFKCQGADAFINILVFLSIIGAIINTFMFDPSKDKYYAICLMRMNAKRYALPNYIYELVKVFIGFMPVTISIGLFYGINPNISILFPFFIVSSKLIGVTIMLKRYEKSKKIVPEMSSDRLSWIMVVICLGLAYGLPFTGYMINSTIFMILTLISVILGIVCSIYIGKFNDYNIIYKKILTNPAFDEKSLTEAQTKHAQSQKMISEDVNFNLTSNKKGFEYFNELFMKRHKKILSKSAKVIAGISFLIIIALIITVYLNEDIKQQLNDVMLTFLPYFTFVMYMINRGQVVTQAMFMNCDHSMLTYSCYKRPASILKLFTIRLKSVIKINLLPAFVIAIGLPVLLYVTGGTDNIYNYIILFVSIIAMSIFFSIHHLVLYYLLQPYNVNIESKSSMYAIANTITYIACYGLLRIKIPTIPFGIATIVFAILYSLIALVLVYKYAPKTFKLRV